MKLRKFQAGTMQEAMATIRRELGPDALVIATRNIKRGLLRSGVEVTVALEDGDDDEPPIAAARPSFPLGASRPARPAAAPTGPMPAVASGSVAGGTGGTGGVGAGPAIDPSAPVLAEADVERIMAPLRSELRALRTMIRPMASDPAELRREVAALRTALAGAGALAPPPRDLGEIARTTEIVAPSTRRVIALVGPTGVGKTTTIAKLAARAALIDRKRVAIVTLDTFRIGGEEQLRIYADLIGVPLTVVSDPMRLPAAVRGVAAGADMVFIDTAGRSPRDGDAIGELERAFDGVADLEVHLAVSAASSASWIDACVRRHKPLGINRLLFTKLDEAEELAELVRAPARHGRPVSFITTGQRVPEDLEHATAPRLLELAQNGFSATQVAA